MLLHGEVLLRAGEREAVDAWVAAHGTDAGARVANLGRLRALAGTGEVDIVCAHDPDEFDRCCARYQGDGGGTSGPGGPGAWPSPTTPA